MFLFGSAAAALTILVSQGSALPIPVTDSTRSVWQIDAGHSDISFRIRHFMSRVRGTFNQWSGTITADSGQWAAGAVDVTLETASVDTRHERRDADLRSANFFDAANHPTITFKSTKVEASGGTIVITGDLTIKGVTRPVVLEGRFLGLEAAGAGRQRVGFEARGTINRVDYGVTWNRVLEGGGAMLGDDVEIEIAIEATRRTE